MLLIAVNGVELNAEQAKAVKHAVEALRDRMYLSSNAYGADEGSEREQDAAEVVELMIVTELMREPERLNEIRADTVAKRIEVKAKHAASVEAAKEKYFRAHRPQSGE